MARSQWQSPHAGSRDERESVNRLQAVMYPKDRTAESIVCLLCQQENSYFVWSGCRGGEIRPSVLTLKKKDKKTMLVEEVKRRVQEICDEKHNNEGAHSMEDQLYFDLLEAIAAGTCEDPKTCAAEAIKTDDIRFERWYA